MCGMTSRVVAVVLITFVNAAAQLAKLCSIRVNGKNQILHERDMAFDDVP